MLLFCSSFSWKLQEVRSQTSQPCLGFQCWGCWVLCFYNAGFRTGSSCWAIDRMVDVQGLATVDFFSKWLWGFFCLSFRSISGGIEGTGVTASSFLTVSAAFFYHLRTLTAIRCNMDSRYCSFLPVPPSRCPDLSIAVSCDLASHCSVQVPMTTATGGVFSGRDWERGRDIEMIFLRMHCF